ncbi:hypothetical protein VTL71DRAFT_6432 [Oculimacula yallundae]|uniref:SET domain-containing protein n=1 Tax=Oculimacula yallundae TaxID=86028 RepID=A0ABR4BY35_9HELO
MTYEECIPYELSGWRLELVQQCFSQHPRNSGIDQFYNERPSDSELRRKILECSGGTVYSMDLVEEGMETVQRSINRSWDIYHEGKVPASNFMRSRKSVPYEIVNLIGIEGERRGMIASRDLKAGETILEEFPIIVTILPLQHSIPLLFLLPQKALEAILLLHNESRVDGLSPRKTTDHCLRLTGLLQGTMDENVWRVWHTANMLMRVLTLTGSMFNHSSRPNIIRGWDRKTEETTFITKCDVKKGEELVLDYCPRGCMSNEARELYLRRNGLWSVLDEDQ